MSRNKYRGLSVHHAPEETPVTPEVPEVTPEVPEGVDWDEVYNWAFGYNKANTPYLRMSDRFKGKHGKRIKGTREGMEQIILELYNAAK